LYEVNVLFLILYNSVQSVKNSTTSNWRDHFMKKYGAVWKAASTSWNWQLFIEKIDFTKWLRAYNIILYNLYDQFNYWFSGFLKNMNSRRLFKDGWVFYDDEGPFIFLTLIIWFNWNKKYKYSVWKVACFFILSVSACID